MAHDQRSQGAAESQEDEPILLLGVIRIGDQQGALVKKHGMSFVKGDAVSSTVCRILPVVPLEPDRCHTTV